MDRNDHHHAKDGYEDLFIAFGRTVEKWLAGAIVVLLAALVVSQLLLQNPHLRYLMVKVEQLEGHPYEPTMQKTLAK